jgi:hypothetical protein
MCNLIRNDLNFITPSVNVGGYAIEGNIRYMHEDIYSNFHVAIKLINGPDVFQLVLIFSKMENGSTLSFITPNCEMENLKYTFANIIDEMNLHGYLGYLLGLPRVSVLYAIMY